MCARNCQSYQPLKPRLAVRLVRGERGYVVARDRALVLAHQPEIVQKFLFG